MFYSITPVLTHEYINSYVSDYDIYCYYIGERFIINKVFNSPLRKDENPSFGIIENKEGALIYHDFATGDSGNAITFVKEKLGLDHYNQALETIYKDLIVKGERTSGDILKPLKSHEKGLKKDIGVKRQKLTQVDIDYWAQFGITPETLKLFNVDSIKYFFVNDVMYWSYTEINPMYSYKVYDKFKIYRPKATKKDKWRGNLTKNYIFGYKQLPKQGDLLIITKSLKDVMCLYNLGYTAISPTNEGTLLPIKCIEDIKQRFKKIIILYDNDYAGIKAAENLGKKFDLNHTIIPLEKEAKDITDYYVKYGKDKTIELLKDLL